jgi:hypothetical protein
MQARKMHPLSLQKLHLDGKHAKDVKTCIIKQKTSHDLAMEKEQHNWFSMAFVMGLFYMQKQY